MSGTVGRLMGSCPVCGDSYIVRKDDLIRRHPGTGGFGFKTYRKPCLGSHQKPRTTWERKPSGQD